MSSSGPQPRRKQSRKGSMADVPKDLLQEIKRLEDLFTVDTAKLKAIVDHFISELAKGLSVEGGSIPMNPTWCMGFPTGNETGTFLALDMGGTNLRVCEINLPEEKGEFDIIQSKYRLPEDLKTGTADELWAYIADCLQQFIEYHHEGEKLDRLPLGFTFSYPATQNYIDHGILQRWTKGFDIEGVEGKDVVPPFEAALEERGVPIKLTALINDTTGTLIASSYTDSEMKIGCIFGTGCNAAYMEHFSEIPKLAHMKVDPKQEIAINCEWGAFDNEHKILPRTQYDVIIDKDSPRPGQQSFEKMIAGLYLGELFRLVLVDLHEQPHVKIFEGQDVSALKKPYSLDASFLSDIENDPFENLQETDDTFHTKLNIKCLKPELELIRRLAELIGTRSARLSACGVAAICKKKGYKTAHVGADGSVFNKYPHFKARGAQALKEILDWDKGRDGKPLGRGHDPVEILPAEDGSGVGAALIAALTLKRVQEGNVMGIRDPEGMLKGTKASDPKSKQVAPETK
ncbi:hexokinase [Friedmanniomyces endolithicus]|uniref:Phosphotransferase n=1 Tax=Friedmanniomyces endolithicus TaxID=329885 RepID=A0AAN6KTL2_9PEZI|nr:hexokinase [Friedmanniomyces endolithicus]KAK0284418.1 hexokinase [Friedmanniomyces endolithicus]KAK0323072.1 hexokinase [Friedmanniomyces endolithicus]KAK0996040.1 hexokinase [Friedmanniomyces endolithicus]KAK1002752.1 hexokinase [Friedmanniomyces endolithicus]